MSKKIRSYTRASRQYHVTTKLQRQGGAPAGLYGHQQWQSWPLLDYSTGPQDAQRRSCYSPGGARG
eukprot:206731-Pyramimonas_sp.AAC.1